MLKCHLQQTRLRGVLHLPHFSQLYGRLSRVGLLGCLRRHSPVRYFWLLRRSGIIVLTRLFLRTRRESRSGRHPGEYCLADFLMHLRADEAPDLNLMSSRIQETPLPAFASFTQSEDRQQVPKVSMLIGDSEPPHNDHCSPVPLVRLLQKEFLGARWQARRAQAICISEEWSRKL